VQLYESVGSDRLCSSIDPLMSPIDSSTMNVIDYSVSNFYIILSCVMVI